MVFAQGRSFIRDTEIEETLRMYATPIFQAAGLDANGVSVYIVSDNSLNAFVAGGQKLFINTGLLLKADTPEQVMGVMAHETGHIAGGHLSRIHDQLRNASAISILSTLAGVAAGVAAGRSDVGTAAILGGQNVAQRNFLAYSRTQESSADQAGVKFLTDVGISSRGMLDFMKKLEGQELLSTASQDPYLRSHPLTTERVDFLANFVANSDLKDKKVSPELYERHARMRAKLYAFTATLQKSKAGKAAQREAIMTLAQLMAPMTPHLAEEIWTAQGGDGLITTSSWPQADEAMLVDDTVTLPIQINGKRRAEIQVPADMPKEEVEKIALSHEAVIRTLDGATPKKVIVVPGRIVNVVA